MARFCSPAVTGEIRTEQRRPATLLPHCPSLTRRPLALSPLHATRHTPPAARLSPPSSYLPPQTSHGQSQTSPLNLPPSQRFSVCVSNSRRHVVWRWVHDLKLADDGAREGFSARVDGMLRDAHAPAKGTHAPPAPSLHSPTGHLLTFVISGACDMHKVKAFGATIRCLHMSQHEVGRTRAARHAPHATRRTWYCAPGT